MAEYYTLCITLGGGGGGLAVMKQRRHTGRPPRHHHHHHHRRHCRGITQATHNVFGRDAFQHPFDETEKDGEGER